MEINFTMRGHSISFGEAARVWARIASLSFGGPAGQIAVMHRILVEEKRWIGEARFLHALNYCMLLPGPEAHQLAVYIGWLMHRIPGGLMAGTLFILPGLVALGILSWIYAVYGEIGFVKALFFGLQAAVLAVVIEAVLRIGRRALKTNGLVAISAFAFAGIFFFGLPFPLIIVMAALIGFAGFASGSRWLQAGPAHGAPAHADEAPALLDGVSGPHTRPSLSRFVRIAFAGFLLWLGPLALLLAALGPENVFSAIAAFNSKMAVVTFGGAYAVLAYMAQQAVEHYRWLQPDEMLVGLGFAETTPGPLICVVQFVGFMAAFRNPGALDPVLAGTLGGLLAMWSTFVPSFLWIFLGGPYVEALLEKKALTASLSAVTAAVVGVILNLAVWFALHTLFGRVDTLEFFGMKFQTPVLETIDPIALFLGLIALAALFWLKLGIVRTFLACSLVSLAFYLVSRF